MSIAEVLKPTANTQTGDTFNNPGYAYDGDYPSDNSTFAHATDYTGTIEFHTFGEQKLTYESLVLVFTYEIVVTGLLDNLGADYSTDGGNTWLGLVPYTVHAATAKTALIIALSADQDITQLMVRVRGKTGLIPAGQTFRVWDIHTEGIRSPYDTCSPISYFEWE